MGSGVSSSTKKREDAIAQSQADTASAYEKLSQQSLAKMDTLTAPQISHDTGLINAANSGNYSQLLQAAGPTVGTISQQMNSAKGSIMDSVPSGAGRDAALAQLPIQAATADASALNSAYSGALTNLTQIGAGYGGIGMQQAGASISSNQGASSTTQAVANQQAQGKADTMGLLGSIAGGAGTAIGGMHGGCWIAEACYGQDDIRTHLLRAWLNGPFKRRLYGRMTMWLYLRFGRRIAPVVGRSPRLQRFCKVFFESQLRHAVAYSGVGV